MRKSLICLAFIIYFYKLKNTNKDKIIDMKCSNFYKIMIYLGKVKYLKIANHEQKAEIKFTNNRKGGNVSLKNNTNIKSK